MPKGVNMAAINFRLKMSHLILDSSINVQKMAYQFLQGAARKRTEHLVIEAGVDTEDTFKAELPFEILDILQRTVIPNETAGLEQEEQARVIEQSWYLFIYLQ
jgi:hypothetical protein